MDTMKVVRSRSLLSEKDSCSLSVDSFADEDVKKSKRRACQVAMAFAPGLSVFASELKLNPGRTLKKVCCKLLMLFWCLCILCALLTLIGFDLSPIKVSSIQTDSRDDDDARGFFSGLMINPFYSSSANLTQGSIIDDVIEEEVEEEEIVQQHIPMSKEGNKLNKRLERKLACEEAKCVDACNQKIKPKCAKSRSCRNERDKICKRRCRKARCEERCKDEPSFGYVEREQRMDKCKEDCNGPTAVHNKCIKKCHSKFKPCKARCYEIASKFQCDEVSPKPPSMPTQANTRSLATSASKSASRAKEMELLQDPEII